MSPSFLMFLAAAVILHVLARQARAGCEARVARLFPRALARRRLDLLLRDHPDQIGAFRVTILPLAGARLCFDALACGVFLAGIFLFPPAQFGPTDRGLIQYGGTLIVAVALLVDAIIFCRLVLATATRKDVRTKSTKQAHGSSRLRGA